MADQFWLSPVAFPGILLFPDQHHHWLSLLRHIESLSEKRSMQSKEEHRMYGDWRGLGIRTLDSRFCAGPQLGSSKVRWDNIVQITQGIPFQTGS